MLSYKETNDMSPIYQLLNIIAGKDEEGIFDRYYNGWTIQDIEDLLTEIGLEKEVQEAKEESVADPLEKIKAFYPE
jgi:hypothetical protein